MKKTATQTLLAAAFAIGTAGLLTPVIAQEAEAPVEMTDEELDAAMAELLEAELDACDGDEVCIDTVLNDYEIDLDVALDVSPPEDGMTASSAAEGEASGAAASASAGAAATETVAPDDEGVLNSASEADEDSDGTGGTTRPGTRPDRQ